MRARADEAAGVVDDVASRPVAPGDALRAARAGDDLAVVDEGDLRREVGHARVDVLQAAPDLGEIAYAGRFDLEPVMTHPVVEVVGEGLSADGHLDVVDLGQAIGVVEAVLVGPGAVGESLEAQLQLVAAGAAVIAGLECDGLVDHDARVDGVVLWHDVLPCGPAKALDPEVVEARFAVAAEDALQAHDGRDIRVGDGVREDEVLRQLFP